MDGFKNVRNELDFLRKTLCRGVSGKTRLPALRERQKQLESKIKVIEPQLEGQADPEAKKQNRQLLEQVKSLLASTRKTIAALEKDRRDAETLTRSLGGEGDLESALKKVQDGTTTILNVEVSK